VARRTGSRTTPDHRSRAAPGTGRNGDRSAARPSRRAVLAGAGALTLAACTERSTMRNTIESIPPHHRIRPLEHGVFLPGGPQEGPAYAALTGSAPRWMLLFRDWTHETPPLGVLDAVLAQGATPVLTWEPWYAPSGGAGSAGGARQPPFALDRLLAGDHEYRIRTWAEALAGWGRDVVLRFAHEMNGDWYPWGAGVQANTAEQYVRAWRHVHDRFAAAGADNVRWCWAPNVPAPTGEGPGGTGLADFFPGPDVVDLLGIDGYNWGSATPPLAWTGPQDLFGPGLEELRALRSGLPVLVTETASAEGTRDGESKAGWIAQLFDFLDRQGDVRAVVWFQEDKERDWRVDSSPAALAAYRQALTGTR
jgi:hypothetical protein